MTVGDEKKAITSSIVEESQIQIRIVLIKLNPINIEFLNNPNSKFFSDFISNLLIPGAFNTM